MATTPTTGDIPSNAAVDLKFNSEQFDRVMNSDDLTYTDRFGKKRITMKGVQELANGFQDTFTNLLGSPDGFKLIGGVKSFDTLRSTPVRTEGQRIFLKSYYENGTTGGGIFVGHIGTKLDDGGTVAQGINYYWERIGNDNFVTPQMFGAVGDGVTQDSGAIINMFKSSFEHIKFSKGTYLINKKVKILLTKNVIVYCDPGVVFKLDNLVRNNMFVFVGNRENSFSWRGGEFDGNWSGQGEETLNATGTFKDLSHGFIVSLFKNAKIEDMYVHDFRGHSVNHGGNINFHAKNLRFNSHIATAFPQGGSRGDGVTGCSENILIEDIYGFTTDDMVAVVAGCLWIEGGTEADSDAITNLDYLMIKNVTIKNINPWYKISDLDGVTKVYTWNGVVVNSQGGYGVEKVSISGVKGFTQYSAVRVGSEVSFGNAPLTDYYSEMGSINISDIDVRVNGSTGNQHLYNTIRVGNVIQPSSYTNTYPSTIKSLTLSNIKCWPSGNARTLIAIGYTEISTLNINGVTVNGSVPDDVYNSISIVGDRQIPVVSINGVIQNPPSASTDTIAQAQLLINWGVTHPTPSKVYAKNVSFKRNGADTVYVSNFFLVTGSTAPELYSEELVVRSATNFTLFPKVKGVRFRDRYLGLVSVDLSGNWRFDEFSTVWDSTTYGKPSASTMTGYSNIVWVDGMFVGTKGSPYGEVQGWRYNKDGNWQMVGGTVVNNMVSIISSSSVPTSFTPYCTVRSPIYNDSTWPESYGVVDFYTGHPNSRATAFQTFNGIGNNVYRRTWNTNTGAWNAWVKTIFS